MDTLLVTIPWTPSLKGCTKTEEYRLQYQHLEVSGVWIPSLSPVWATQWVPWPGHKKCRKGDGERGSVAKGLVCSSEDQCSDPRPYVTSWANACNSISEGSSTFWPPTRAPAHTCAHIAMDSHTTYYFFTDTEREYFPTLRYWLISLI